MSDSFVIGTRPQHTHVVDGKEIKCNSAYCDTMEAHPLDQENQKPPWSNRSR